MGYPQLSIPLVPLNIILLLCVCLNKKGFLTIARFTTLIISCLYVSLYSLMTDVRIGSSSLLFSFLCATCVIFSTDERGKILISCGFEIILYYLTHFLKDIAWIYKVGITEFQIKIIHIGTSGATFSVIFFCVWFFVKNSVKREEKLKVANLSIQMVMPE